MFPLRLQAGDRANDIDSIVGFNQNKMFPEFPLAISLCAITPSYGSRGQIIREESLHCRTMAHIGSAYCVR